MDAKPRGPSPWRSVAFKLSALTSIFVLAVIGLMAQNLFRQAEQGLLAEMSVRGRFFALAVREAITPRVDAFQLHFQVEQMRREKAVLNAAVLDAEGVVLSHSDPSLIGSRPRDPFTQAALRAPEPSLQRVGAAYDLAVPVELAAKRVGTVRIGFDQSSLQEALRGTRRRIAAVAAVSTAAAILGTFLIVGWIMRPLPRLAAAAKEVARGNFAVQVEWRSNDEIGLLARSFNEMTIANALLFKSIREEKQKIETIFNATIEGLVWTDKTGRVLLMNPAARDLLACRDRAAATWPEAAAGFAAKPALDDLLAGRRRVAPFELTRAQPKLLILSGVADRLGGENGAEAGFLFIFRDATLERRGESLARNFLSIVSHKLRTPLAVVLGYIEVLQGDQGLGEFPLDALRRMRAEEEKLARLVEKLIVFTAVQNPESIVLNRTECAPAEIVAAALKSFPLPPGAEVIVDEAALAAAPKFSADFALIKECVANLVENALKFNPAPRKEARVSVRVDGALLRVTVSDNGPGIPGEEHPKLFRRFYQIDPDFTGQVPGMGLGLAFVKSAAEAHGGGAGLRSEPGKGSEFFFFLPVGV